jgi:hypothetical protein
MGSRQRNSCSNTDKVVFQENVKDQDRRLTEEKAAGYQITRKQTQGGEI